MRDTILLRQQAALEAEGSVWHHGLADMLCKFNLRYDSDEGIGLPKRRWRRSSPGPTMNQNIAAEKSSFPIFNAANHLENPFFKDFPPELIEKIEKHGLRNVTLLTIPPTGSIAAMAGVTSGVEPIFDVKYVRRSESLSESIFEVEHPLITEYRKISESRRKIHCRRTLLPLTQSRRTKEF
jgi:ribonucleoside-diphosphate reductase alpha chain